MAETHNAPDLAFLTQLANQMFRALPTDNPLPLPTGAAAGPALGGFGTTAAIPANPTIPSLPDAGKAMAVPLVSFAAAVPNVPALGVGQPDLTDVTALLASTRTPSSVPASAKPTFASMAEPEGLYFLPAAERSPGEAVGSAPFDVQAIRKDFPILQERVNGRPLVWLDNAATTQKPKAVIERLTHFYEHENSNIHRAAHELAARSTDAYEQARQSVQRFLNAESVNNIIFVRGASEGINLIAQAWGRWQLKPGDEIIVTWLEHHANIVPWQQVCQQTGAVLRVVPVDDRGQIRLDEYQKLLGHKTRLVALTQVSNALGTVTPAAEMVAMAHRVGARVLVDGAQAVSHMPVNVQALDADWYVFSGHKVFGPTGIGAVYGKADALDDMQPWQGGGNMIRDVTFEKTEYQPAPAKFEAGTGNIADAVGLGAALDYVMSIGMEVIARYEHDLLVYGTRLLSDIPGLRLIGTAQEKAGVLSFVLDGLPPDQVGKALNQHGIAVRAGHHCAQPILRRFGLEATVRPSLAFYNTYAELEQLASALRGIRAG